MIRMKKVISIGTVLVMLLSLCACWRTEKGTSSDEYMVHSTTETSSDADVDSSQTTVTAGQSDEDASLNIEDSSAPVVFFTSDISAEGLARLYEKCRKGTPVKNSTYDTGLFKYCDRVGIPRFSMHVLGHTFTTRCIEGGMKPKTLQKILGHSNIGITMNLYVHITEDEKQREIDLVADALKVV